MATIPVPRSYNEILGDMIDAFLSRFGLRSLKIGSPVLSVLESVAQSQLRSSEDIFTLLEAQSLDNASGIALDNIGADESTPRIAQNPSSGTVTISDTSFTKIASKLFQGTPAPIVGSTAVNVVDASAFPSSGSVYLGRGTQQYEGPIAYSSKTNNGTYWTLNLSAATLRFHNQGESVIVAQGGDRQIAAGTLVQTPQGNTTQSVQFKTLFTSTVPDGETILNSVLVVCQTPGIVGNIASTSINQFTNGTPFTGAAVSNLLPFTNGTSIEDDDTYRERIREARQTRTKGTALAIQTNAVGVTATDENKRVLSASVVSRQSLPTTLFIDDGTGYEMVASGVAIETLIDQAFGGEQYFKVSQRPVAKAFVQSTISAPFSLAAGMKLSFSIDNVITEHTFNADEFRDITNATAYEVVASINADSTLNWQARTAGSGSQVVCTAKADTDESIQNQLVLDGKDANPFLGFPTGRVDTMRLYLDDRLLFKDGRLATVTSNTPNNWSTLSGPQSLIVSVDGISLSFDGTQFAKFTDQDFINAATGYATLGKNTLNAWAAVFNYRIPGITASVQAGVLVLTSNRGHLATAGVSVVSGDLVNAHMFAAAVAVGANQDYTLDRNTGELGLTVAMSAGSKLAAGSVSTRAFINTPSITTVNLSGNGNLWTAIDAGATVISTGVTSATSLTFTSTANSMGFRIRCTAGTAVFNNVKAGDWVVFWDSAISASLFGSYRVEAVDPSFTWFEIEKATTYSASPLVLPSAGIMFVRTTVKHPLQKLTVASGTNYTASSLVTSLNALLKGSLAQQYRTNILRVRTNTISDVNGSMALVAADINGQKIGLPISNAVKNLTGHMASLESGNSELGTPDFVQGRVQAVTSGTAITIDRLQNIAPGSSSMLYVLRANDIAAGTISYSSQFGFRSTLQDVTVNGSHWNLDLNKAPEQTWLINDRLMFARMFDMSPNDQFTVLVDGDTSLKRFTIPMWRTLKPTTNTYGATNAFTDADNGNSSLTVAFGSTYSFNDFAVYMPARAQTDSGSSTKAVLWRYYRLGAEGNNAQVRYQNPAGPLASVGLAIDNTTDNLVDISVTLASGAARTLTNIRNTTYVGYAYSSTGSGTANVTYVVGFAITSGTRTANTPTLTLTLLGGITNHGLVANNFIYVNSTDVNYPSGTYKITSATATTITYSDASASTSAFAGAGTVSNDTVAEANINGGGVVAGDFFVMPNNPNGGTALATMRVISVAAQGWTGVTQNNGGSTTVTWMPAPIADPTKFLFFANPAQTTSTIVAAVNALTNPIIKGKLIGDGTGVIDRSSLESLLTSVNFTALTDGINFIKTTTVSGNYSMVFKNPITSGLATNSDWANETVVICPRSAANIVAWFNTLGVTGLSSVAEIVASSNAAKVQIASLTAGSTGSLQVQGGTANSATATVVGSASLNSSSSNAICSVQAASVAGFNGGTWCSVDNEYTMPRTGVFDANTALTSITTGGVFTFNSGGTPVVTLRSAANNCVVKVESQGKFIAIRDTSFGTNGMASLNTVQEGDWVHITTPVSPIYATPIASGNTGIYRVVRTQAPDFDSGIGTFWIENTNAVAQNQGECDIVFIAPNSILPGDTVSISTSLWGIGNLGSWTVTAVPGINVTAPATIGSAYTFTVDISSKIPAAIGVVGTLGAGNAALVQCIEGIPAHFVKKIISISQNPLSQTLADVKFDTPNGYTSFNANAGTVITALNKLAFTTNISNGIDGYQYNTGLIQEVNRVEYGDPSDPATYPGVIAAGAVVNIEGAPIKRIQVSIALRVRSGAPTTDVANSAKSAVAAVINGAGVGASIALIDIATAAKVPGVISVIMISPQMVTGTDLISVQSFEKPLVLNLDTDILISFVGD